MTFQILLDTSFILKHTHNRIFIYPTNAVVSVE